MAKIKKVKLDYRHDDHRWKHRATSIASNAAPTLLNKLCKIENITILVLLVLAQQINGIYSHGKYQVLLINGFAG